MVPPPAGQTAKTALAMADPAPGAATEAPSGAAPGPDAKSKGILKIRKSRKAKDKGPTPEPESKPEAKPETKPDTPSEPAPESKPESEKPGLLSSIIKVSRQRMAEPPTDHHEGSDDSGAGPEPKPGQGEPAPEKEKPAPAADQPAPDKQPSPDGPPPEAKSDDKPAGDPTGSKDPAQAEPAPEPAAIIAEEPKPRKQKPGRPRKRLDTPAPVAATAPLPAAPAIRRMSDITPKPAAAPEQPSKPAPHPEPEESPDKPAAKHSHRLRHKQHSSEPKAAAPDQAAKPHAGHAKPAIHKVGLPPLHYASVLNFSLRARVRPQWLALSAAALVALLAAFVYGGWLLVNVPASALLGRAIASGPQLLMELAVLAALYYIGRSISQTAIIYGIAREADARPVSLSRQLGIGINTFGRRFVLDLTFSIVDLILLGLMLILFITGGNAWPVSPEIQVAAIFVAYLILLYLLTGLALARGLAGVALTLTQKETWPAIRFGWELFSHRFELLGLRFLALAMELLLALPLAALALAIIVSAPGSLHPLAAVGIGLLAWLAGALLGAGTAAWWTALYRRLILADHQHHNDSTEAVALLSSRQPQQARRAPLTLIVALSSFLLAAALALPWLRQF